MTRTARAVLVLATLVALKPDGAAAQVTVGTANTGNCYPFICMAGDGGTRYQQVYSSSSFSSAMFINSLTWYRNYWSGSQSFDGSTYTLSLSTTSAGVGALSSNADANLGANNQLFYSGIVSGAVGTGFTLTGTSFLYDPSMGNLLLDVIITNPHAQGYVTFLDADNTGRSTSRTWNWQGQQAPQIVDNAGLVTTFQGTVVPEPATITLMATGFAGLAGAYRRRKNAKIAA